MGHYASEIGPNDDFVRGHVPPTESPKVPGTPQWDQFQKALAAWRGVRDYRAPVPEAEYNGFNEYRALRAAGRVLISWVQAESLQFEPAAPVDDSHARLAAEMRERLRNAHPATDRPLYELTHEWAARVGGGTVG